jgi:hypothetical protein
MVHGINPRPILALFVKSTQQYVIFNVLKEYCIPKEEDVDIWIEIPIQHDVYIWANYSVSSYSKFIPSPPASLSGLIWESRANTRADMENVM